MLYYIQKKNAHIVIIMLLSVVRATNIIVISIVIDGNFGRIIYIISLLPSFSLSLSSLSSSSLYSVITVFASPLLSRFIYLILNNIHISPILHTTTAIDLTIIVQHDQKKIVG
jgi:hypothetical protein